MRYLTDEDKQHIISHITKEERAAIEAIMDLLNGYSFNQAKNILEVSGAILTTALIDSSKCAQFFEE